MSERNVEKATLTDAEREAVRVSLDYGGTRHLFDAIERIIAARHAPALALAGEWTAEHRRAESHACSPDIPLGRAARLMREALSSTPATPDAERPTEGEVG
ncbi:MAG: hypothetical protein ACXVHX_34325 [Solirubrobacteraceae bacterium]